MFEINVKWLGTLQLLPPGLGLLLPACAKDRVLFERGAWEGGGKTSLHLIYNGNNRVGR